MLLLVLCQAVLAANLLAYYRHLEMMRWYKY